MSGIQDISGAEPEHEIDQDKAQSPWMIGLLVMLFGILGMCVSAMNLYLGIIDLGNVRSEWTSIGLDMNFVYLSLVVGLIVGCWMTFIGARLLKYKDNGRRHFDYYLIFFISWTLIAAVYQYLMVPEGFARQVILNDMIPELVGKAAMLGLFLLCRYLLNRKETRIWLS